MTGRTHEAAGALVGTIIGYHTGNWLLGMSAGTIGGLLPDIDDPNSILGKALVFISYPLNKLVGHRTYTHTVWFAIVVAIVAKLLSGAYLIPYLNGSTFSQEFAAISSATVWIPLFAGILTHLLLDAITKAGIHPILPIKWHIYGPFKTNGEFDYAISIICALALAAVLGTASL